MFPSFPKALASCLLSSLCILPAIAIPVNALITTALSGTELAPFDHSLGSGLLTHLPPPQRGVLAGRTETPGGLFGANGVPDIADLDQTTIPDCGLIAAVGALVGQHSEWITNLFEFKGDAGTTTAATVKLVRGITFQANPKTVQKSSLTNARSDAHEGWWVGALEQAITSQEGKVEGIFPDRALEVITGRKATFKIAGNGSNSGRPGALSKDQFWDLVSNNARKTPMILQSRAGAVIFTESHAFWIQAGHVDGKRWVSLWNPYGIDEVYDLEAIWPWIWGVHMFADMSEQPRKGKTG